MTTAKNSILVTGDILRPDKSNLATCQTVNIHWLYNLFKWQLERTSGTTVEWLSWTPKQGQFSGELFYQFNGLKPNLENWSTIFSSTHLHPLAEEYYLSFVENALIVSFELPDCLIHLLQKHNIPYIDFTIHPVRFLDDIFFALRTNIGYCAEILKSHSCDESLFYLHASVHSASLARMGGLKLPENSALIAGQTPVDKSLIDNGNLRNMYDYKNQLLEIAQQHDTVFFKPHPILSMISLQELKTLIPNVEIINENTYQLICNDSISNVYSISSSVVSECQYFSKSASYFYKSPFRHWEQEKCNKNDGWVYYPIYQDYFSSSFWTKMLMPYFDTPNDEKVVVPHKGNRLRLSLQEFWGYNFLEFEPYNNVQRRYEQSKATA